MVTRYSSKTGEWIESKYHEWNEKRFAIEGARSSGDFGDGTPEPDSIFRVTLGVTYYDNDLLELYMKVNLGDRNEKQYRLGDSDIHFNITAPRLVDVSSDFEEVFTAGTTDRMYSAIDEFVRGAAFLAVKSETLKAGKAGEFREKLRDATRSGIEELIVG